MSTLPQQNTIFQYTANGSSTTYSYACLVESDVDLDVYVTPPNAIANPAIDKKILNSDYTIQDIGTITGGTITFNSPPVSNSIITIDRNIKATITTQFSDVSTFDGENLDSSLRRLMMITQQNQNDIANRVLGYTVNQYLPTTTNESKLPRLQGDRHIWMKQGANILSVNLEENPNVTTLRDELASNLQDSDGARKIGYFDDIAKSQTTIRDIILSLNNKIRDLDRFFPGDLVKTYNPVAPYGWLILQDGTVGSANSNATLRANIDAYDVYTIFWNNYNDVICPVIGGRGASADSDFYADKPLTLPLNAGMVYANYSSISVPGTNEGSRTHTNTEQELAAHSHKAKPSSTASTASFVTSEPSPGSYALVQQPDGGIYYGNQDTAVSGEGKPFSIMQPTSYIYIKMKL